jgi:hypothetical protein
MVRFEPPAGPGRRHATGEHMLKTSTIMNRLCYIIAVLPTGYLEWSELNSMSLKIFATYVQYLHKDERFWLHFPLSLASLQGSCAYLIGISVTYIIGTSSRLQLHLC